VALLALLAAAPAALGAVVSHGSTGDGRLNILVLPLEGPDGARHLVVEPFADAFRDGWRVRTSLPGGAPVTVFTGDCVRNPIANDVVCNGPRGRVTAGFGDGDDSLLLDQRPVQNVESCAEGAVVVRSAELLMRAGDDVVAVGPPAPNPCPTGATPARAVLFALDVDGDEGADRLFGGGQADVLDGGADDDTIEGREGRDLLRGDGGADTVSGGPGDDALAGGIGGDTLRGDEGDDTFEGGPGDDVFDGGPGTDTVNYRDATAAGTNVAATIGDDTSGDGPVGERDRIGASVENVIGGRGADSVIGSAGRNELRGFEGGDTLRGAGGDDTLRGDAGDDVLAGGPGRDRLDGGPDADRLLGQEDADVYLAGAGDDSVDARDGVPEEIDCGPGTDIADVDLKDTVPGLFLLGRCETVFRSPADDGAPSRVAGRTLRMDRGRRARVVVVCPATARVACRGVLTLRGVRGARVLARGSYAVPRGRRAAVSLVLRAAVPREVVVTTRERGVSRLGPRGSRTVLRVVGARR